MAGLWEFPGGKLEVGEQPEACLVRDPTHNMGLSNTMALIASDCGATFSPEQRMALIASGCALFQWRTA